MDALGSEELLCKISHHLGLIELAAKNVQIGCVACVCEMSRYKRGLYQLRHGVSCNPFFLPKIHHLGLTETFHLDEVAKFDNKLSYFIGASDGLGITFVEIHTGKESPRLVLCGRISVLIFSH